MEDQGRRGALSPPLLLGLGLKASVLVFAIAAAQQEPSAGPGTVMGGALGVAAMVLIGSGLLALASQHVAKARRGLQVAGLSWLALAALQVVSDLAFAMGGHMTPWIRLVQSSFGVALLCGAVGLAVAAWHRRPALALAGLVSVILGPLLVFLAASDVLGASYRAIMTLDSVTALVRIAVVALTAVVLAGGPRPAGLARLGGDLRTAARALRFAVGVMVCVTGAVVLFGPRGSGSSLVVSVAGALGVVAGAAMFAWLGLALLRAARDRGAAVPPYGLAIAAVFALWCGRMLLLILPAVCGVEGPARRADDGLDVVATVTLSVPIAIVLGAAVLAATIASFARREHIEALRRRAFRHAWGVLVATVVLPLAMVPANDVHPSLAALLFVVVCCAQTVLLARLCDGAAVAVDRGSALPEVRVVNA